MWIAIAVLAVSACALLASIAAIFASIAAMGMSLRAVNKVADKHRNMHARINKVEAEIDRMNGIVAKR